MIPASRMGGTIDRVIAGLQRRLDREPDTALRRGMHYPTTWDPFFTGYMTLYELYRYPTRHFDHHRREYHAARPGLTNARRLFAGGQEPGPRRVLRRPGPARIEARRPNRR